MLLMMLLGIVVGLLLMLLGTAAVVLVWDRWERLPRGCHTATDLVMVGVVLVVVVRGVLLLVMIVVIFTHTTLIVVCGTPSWGVVGLLGLLVWC